MLVWLVGRLLFALCSVQSANHERDHDKTDHLTTSDFASPRYNDDSMNSETSNVPDALEERLRFETLIADLSSEFVNLPAKQVDREIMEAQRRVCEFLGLDLSALWQWSGEVPSSLALTHLYRAQEGPPAPERMDASEYFPWCQQQLWAGRVVAVSSLEALPSEAARDRETWRYFGIKTSLTIPLSVGDGPPVGALSFNTTRAERDWPDTLVNRLKLMAQIFANALARSRSDQALRESEARLSLAAESADAGLWVLDCRTDHFWVTQKARAIFGYTPAEVVSMERFKASVHPDDWDRVQGNIARSLQAGEPVNIEYRIRLGDGRTRWIASRGRPYSAHAGEPPRLMGVSIDVTERRQTEESLRAGRARLEAGSDLVGLGYYEVDYAAHTCFLDDRFREICGMSSNRQNGLDEVQFWQEHVHPDDRQALAGIRQKLHSGAVDQISAEYRYVHPTQGQRWLHHSARVSGRGPGGSGIRTFGVIRDITEQKRIAEQQAEDLRFVTLIADLSSRFVHLAASEVDREILNTERSICELLGLDVAALWQWSKETPDVLFLTHLYGAVEAPLPDAMQASDYFPWYQEQMLAGRTVLFSSLDDLPPEALRDRAAYRLFGIQSNVTVPLVIGGEPSIGALGFNTTRTRRDWPAPLVKRLQLIAQIFASALARKRSDRHLRESEEVNRATFEQAAVGIAHIDTDGRWLRVNDRYCAIVGYSREELLRMSFQDITHPDDVEADLNQMRRVLSSEVETYSREKRYLRKDRSLVWIHLTVSLVRDSAGEPRHFISVAEDITERKRAEEEVQRMRLQLWHADRVAQTGAITASLAHELNQPLTGILSTAQAGLRFMARENPDLAEIHGILTNIVHDTKRAGAIINGLRSMLRQKATAREPIRLAETVHGVLALLHSELIDRYVQHRLRVESDCCVLADKAQIQQVILNLVMNAIEAMQHQPAEQRRVELTLTQTNQGEALVSVRDSGPGIPPDQQGMIFTAFWTTKSQGMGIGLPISYSIIESHGGRLWCTNNPDGGATFHFSLPIESDEGRGARDEGRGARGEGRGARGG